MHNSIHNALYFFFPISTRSVHSTRPHWRYTPVDQLHKTQCGGSNKQTDGSTQLSDQLAQGNCEGFLVNLNREKKEHSELYMFFPKFTVISIDFTWILKYNKFFFISSKLANGSAWPCDLLSISSA